MHTNIFLGMNQIKVIVLAVFVTSALAYECKSSTSRNFTFYVQLVRATASATQRSSYVSLGGGCSVLQPLPAGTVILGNIKLTREPEFDSPTVGFSYGPVIGGFRNFFPLTKYSFNDNSPYKGYFTSYAANASSPTRIIKGGTGDFALSVGALQISVFKNYFFGLNQVLKAEAKLCKEI